MSDVTPSDPLVAELQRPTDVVLAVDVGAHSFQSGLVTARGVLIDRRSPPIDLDEMNRTIDKLRESVGMAGEIASLREAMTRPRKVVRDERGSIVGSEVQ